MLKSNPTPTQSKVEAQESTRQGGWEDRFDKEFVNYQGDWSENNIYRDGGKIHISRVKAFIHQEIDKAVKEQEISTLKSVLYRIKLNESNEYPIVDESTNLADVKQAAINRVIQLEEKK